VKHLKNGDGSILKVNIKPPLFFANSRYKIINVSEYYSKVLKNSIFIIAFRILNGDIV